MEQRVGQVRAFNRFYTKQIGALREGLLNSRFSLTEVRVLYEIAHGRGITAKELSLELGLDPGYLSRLLKKFHEQGLLEKQVNERDQRLVGLSLTEKGNAVFGPLNHSQNEEVQKMLGQLTDSEQKQLVRAMEVIRGLLGPAQEGEPYILRPPRPGDIGWVVHRHGALYSEEYGWDQTFEALVAEIAAEFIKNFDPRWERCWIAERKGEIVGSVFLVKKDESTAKLRMLYVEPASRGLGIGKRLVDECIRFAKQVGYQKITLWTQSCLLAARAIYENAGFYLVARNNNRSFGKELVAETWDKEL
jgi:DNA-binding MarR family transcriptional regulator/N-acetylglutamate synthase-like GNAT family acetyltransferase